MRPTLLALAQVLAKPAVAIGGALVLSVVAIGGAYYLTNVSPSGAYTAAVEAPITQSVNVSGPVESAQNTDLSFQVPGQVASINVKVGQHVVAGQTLIALSGGSQAAALASAKANLEEAQANLASLQAGTRSEQLAIDQTTVNSDITTAYVAADTAVHVDADQVFTNPRNASAALTVVVPDSVLVNATVQERIALEQVLTNWNAGIASGTLDPAVAAQDLTQVSTFLSNMASLLAEVQPSQAVPAATLAGYQASIASARSSIAASLSALTGAEGALMLAQAGATPQAIAAGQAQVDAAAAAVQAAAVAAGETVLSAPISGTITAQNANPGQTVAPGIILVSMESDAAFEAKAPVSEADISKVKTGESVNATFDAYPNTNFPAVVTAVDPAATLTNGVASYQVTATFAQNDPRIASGLTAHLSIITATSTDALVIPVSAVITDASGNQFVYAKAARGADQKLPVTTGIEGADGMVQILSGLSAGTKVLTFGNQ